MMSDAVTVPGRELKAMQERITQLEAALKWYGEKAEAMERYAAAEPPKATMMMAVVTELSLDGGKRASKALGGE